MYIPTPTPFNYILELFRVKFWSLYIYEQVATLWLFKRNLILRINFSTY